MFRHVLNIASTVFKSDRIILISRSEALLDEARAIGALAVREAGCGLNVALEQGARIAIARGADALLCLSSDLPGLSADDIRALIEAPAPIAIATDRMRLGTNALLMRPPGAIRFHYGLDSLAAHLAAARAIGLEAVVLERPGLANDIDTPADLAELRKG